MSFKTGGLLYCSPSNKPKCYRFRVKVRAEIDGTKHAREFIGSFENSLIAHQCGASEFGDYLTMVSVVKIPAQDEM